MLIWYIYFNILKDLKVIWVFFVYFGEKMYRVNYLKGGL